MTVVREEPNAPPPHVEGVRGAFCSCPLTAWAVRGILQGRALVRGDVPGSPWGQRSGGVRGHMTSSVVTSHYPPHGEGEIVRGRSREGELGNFLTLF